MAKSVMSYTCGGKETRDGRGSGAARPAFRVRSNGRRSGRRARSVRDGSGGRAGGESAHLAANLRVLTVGLQTLGQALGARRRCVASLTHLVRWVRARANAGRRMLVRRRLPASEIATSKIFLTRRFRVRDPNMVESGDSRLPRLLSPRPAATTRDRARFGVDRLTVETFAFRAARTSADRVYSSMRRTARAAPVSSASIALVRLLTSLGTIPIARDPRL